MGCFGRKKADAAAEESTPDFMVPDVDNSSQQLIVPVTYKNIGCGKRLCSEINPCQSWFHVKDPLNGRVLDIPESFAPASFRAFLWKLLYFGACVGTLVYGEIAATPYFYFAYLTHWGVLWCCLYAVTTVFNTIMASRTPQPAADQAVGVRIRLTWALFVLAAHTSAVATVLYWPLIFDPQTTHITYLTFGPHGVLLLLTLFDGFYINRIPLRWMFWFGLCLPFDVAFLAWTVIHDLLHIGNPDDNDNNPTTNDDAIYPGVLQWSTEWKKSLTWSVIAMLVVGPVLFALLWSLSLGCFCKDTRKYVDSVDPTDERPTVDDVEEGSVFAKWK